MPESKVEAMAKGAVAIGLLILTAGLFAQYSRWNFEDSFIIYRIVRNLLAGHGWAFNVGEVHNASTSVLNTVVIAAGAWVFGDIPRAAHLVGAAGIFTSGCLLVAILRREFGLFFPAVGAVALALVMAGNFTWGLESHLFTALVLLFVWCESTGRNSWWVLGLAVLARPDAMLLVAMKWLTAFARSRTLSIRGILLCAVVLLPWIAFSLVTFHQVFPDTLSNKIWQGRSGFWGPGHVYYHALEAHLSRPLLWYRLALGLSLPGVALLALRRHPLLYFMAFAGAQQAAYVFLNVPGYHWYFAAFDSAVVIAAVYAACDVVVTWLGALLSTEVSAQASARVSAAARAVAPALLLAASLYATRKAMAAPVTDSANGHYVAAAHLINSRSLPAGSVAMMEVGTIGYMTDRPIVDMTGLTSVNPEFISGRHSDVFFEKPPALVILHAPPYPLEQAIYTDPRFSYFYGSGNDVPVPHSPLQYFLRKPDAAPMTAEALDAYWRRQLPGFARTTIGEEPPVHNSCFLDRVNGAMLQAPEMTASRARLEFEGWAVDRIAAAQSSGVLVVLAASGPERRGEAYGVEARRIRRDDVAAVEGREFSNAGFQVAAHALDVPAGAYEILVGQQRGGALVLCDVARRIDLR